MSTFNFTPSNNHLKCKINSQTKQRKKKRNENKFLHIHICTYESFAQIKIYKILTRDQITSKRPHMYMYIHVTMP